MKTVTCRLGCPTSNSQNVVARYTVFDCYRQAV